MKLSSLVLNTSVTIEKIDKNFNLLSESNDENKGEFPSDTIRRQKPLDTFLDKSAVGTKVDSAKTKIRVISYCTRAKLNEIKEKKLIKNGDYIRLKLDSFYLTGILTPAKKMFGLISN